MSSKANRVVFQSFLLAEGETVQCYGGCNLRQEFNVSRCEGRKVKFSCKPGYLINISVAMLGKLNPELHICTDKQSLDCSKDIATELRTTCNRRSTCAVDVTNNQLGNSCGKVKYLAMDIQYVCEIKSTTNVPSRLFSTNRFPTTTTTITTTITRSRETPSKPNPSNEAVKTIPTTNVIELTAITTLPHFTEAGHTLYNVTFVVTKNTKDSDMFWSMTAYTAITNSEFMRRHKTHLALALLLSMFVGMVLCLCFSLDYCRRTKRKRSKGLKESKVTLVPDFQIVESNERIELINPKMMEIITLNGSLPRHKMLSCNEGGYINDDDEDDVYAVSTPFFKRSLEHKLLIHNHMDPKQERPFSPSTLPPPPKHFLHEISSSSSNELLPPPNDFSGDKNYIPCAKITTSTPTGSASNTLRATQKTIPRDRSNSEIVEEIYLEELTSDKNMESSLYEYIEIGQYHAGDEYSSGPHIPRSMTYHRTDNYVVPPNVKFAPMNRRTTSNDETSQEDTFIRNVDSKRMRKCNPKDKPGLHKCRSLDEPKKKTYFANNGKQYLVRNPRRGRIHVMQSCDESVPQRSCNQKAIYSDNEASRRRRRCEVEYKRSCSCHEQGLSFNDLYCMKCGKSEESHLNGCSSLTSNCQSSHDEAYGDHHGPLLSVSNERIKNKQFRVEESGYQSHDTGTDSLCSSTFSTDQEDSRMFLPATLNNCLNNGCRSKACHIRLQASKRDPKLVVVRNHKSKVPGRCRRDDYTNIDAHRHDNDAAADNHPYDSSLDDASSRDSVKIFQKMRKQNLSDLKEDMNCNCLHGAMPSDDIVRMDGIETS